MVFSILPGSVDLFSFPPSTALSKEIIKTLGGAVACPTGADAPQQPMRCSGRLAIPCCMRNCQRNAKSSRHVDIRIVDSSNVQQLAGSELRTG